MRDMAKTVLTWILVVIVESRLAGAHKQPRRTPLDEYIESAGTPVDVPRPSPGSLWIPGALFGDPARDLRASQPGDLVTVVVVERASAVAKGTTKASRSSSVKNSIGAFAGKTRATGPLANLADLSGDSQLAGEGATTRETVLSTTLAGRVTHVLPNGNLVVEASKEVQVNAERQYVTVRGVARPLDIDPGNAVRSDRLAMLEVRIQGKGVVGDAVRRPFFLYRLLLGLLPL
jgi:flagellar L-ring protein precursor FlgH